MYRSHMTRLLHYATLTDDHFAIREAVEELEFTWGHPPRVAAIAERVRLPADTVRRHLADLTHARLVLYRPADDDAEAASGLPVLGEIA